MGTTLLIGSCEPFSGKSALVLGTQQLISQVFRSVLVSLWPQPQWDPDKGPLPQPLIDDDVRFIGETLELSSDRLISLHLLSPTTATLRLGQLDPGEGFDHLRQQVASDAGLTLLMRQSLREGLLYGLSFAAGRGLEARWCWFISGRTAAAWSPCSRPSRCSATAWWESCSMPSP